MGAKWQKVNIKVPSDLGPEERQAVALEVLDFIRTRTQKQGLDKNGEPFPSYSSDYIKSLDFKIAGKSKKVDLTLSGDMLGAMDLLDHRKGQITIGFAKGSEENARADGNIRGTYGQSKSTGKRRDFLGIEAKDLNAILENYDRTSAGDRAKGVLAGIDNFGDLGDVNSSDEGDDG